MAHRIIRGTIPLVKCQSEYVQSDEYDKTLVLICIYLRMWMTKSFFQLHYDRSSPLCNLFFYSSSMHYTIHYHLSAWSSSSLLLSWSLSERSTASSLFLTDSFSCFELDSSGEAISVGGVDWERPVELGGKIWVLALLGLRAGLNCLQWGHVYSIRRKS